MNELTRRELHPTADAGVLDMPLGNPAVEGFKVNAESIGGLAAREESWRLGLQVSDNVTGYFHAGLILKRQRMPTFISVIFIEQNAEKKMATLGYPFRV